MVDTEASSIPTTPWYRRPLSIAIICLVAIGVVLGIVLGVASGNSPSSGASTESASSIGARSGDGSESPGEGPMPVSPTPVMNPTTMKPSFQPSVSHSKSPSVSPTSSPSHGPTVSKSLAPTVMPSPQPSFPPQQDGAIVLGVTSNNIEYYHCQSGDAAATKQIVLLHGASFSKEIWLDHNMLEQFCAGARTVIALDLPVSSNHQGLISVLQALQQDSRIQLPIDMLVTPSASGFTIVDWMRNGNVQDMPNYLSTWVPVATGSLTTASDAQVESLVGQISVLAIHGNDDMAGGRYSNRLGDHANATVVELIGRHAVYLQSPNEFVQTILNY